MKVYVTRLGNGSCKPDHAQNLPLCSLPPLFNHEVPAHHFSPDAAW